MYSNFMNLFRKVSPCKALVSEVEGAYFYLCHPPTYALAGMELLNDKTHYPWDSYKTTGNPWKTTKKTRVFHKVSIKYKKIYKSSCIEITQKKILRMLLSIKNRYEEDKINYIINRN